MRCLPVFKCKLIIIQALASALGSRLVLYCVADDGWVSAAHVDALEALCPRAVVVRDEVSLAAITFSVCCVGPWPAWPEP